VPAAAHRRSLRAWTADYDRAVMARVHATHSAALDRVMPALSQAANHSVLWVGVAAGLAASRDRWARRAALRGLGSVAIASTVTNVAAKRLIRRMRPEAEIPAARQLARRVRTTSFPSGHAASAAAFATGVAVERPLLAVPVGALAAAVGASRVVTGVHFPSDVAAGFAVGVAAGTLTLRWWPRRAHAPAQAVRPRREAPAAPDGAGLVLVMNAKAGSTSGDLAAFLSAELPQARVLLADQGSDLPALLHEAAATASILGVAGGDGSVRLAAGIAADKGLPLLVVPAGTFNHFATDLGVRTEQDAVAALQAGDSVLVDVADAGGEAYLNTASTGIYVDLVRTRHSLENRLGKWPAVLVALARVLRSSRPIELLVDGRRTKVWLLFAGNCVYEPAGAAPSYRPDLADGQLDIRLVDGHQPMARTRLILAVLLGTLSRSRVYRTWTADSLRIAAADGGEVLLSADGEAIESQPSLTIRKRPARLLVYRPDGS
jgi:diacylglycerol kinase family enzyme/membrane-associated phospholipid phosphatase